MPFDPNKLRPLSTGGFDASKLTPAQSGQNAFQQSTDITAPNRNEGALSFLNPLFNVGNKAIDQATAQTAVSTHYSTPNAVHDFAQSTLQNRQEHPQSGLGAWFTQEIPAMGANLVNAGEQIIGGVKNAAVGGWNSAMEGSKAQPNMDQYRQSAKQQAQGLSDIWSGALGVLGAPAPLLPDIVEKPVTAVLGGASHIVDSAASGGLQAVGIDPNSAAGSILRQNVQNAFNTLLIAKGEPITKGIGEFAGKTVEGMAKKTLSPFEKSYNPSAAGAFQEAGITPTASMVSRSPVINMLETIQSKGFFGNKLATVADEARTGIQDFVQKHIDEISKHATQESVGNALIDSFHNFKEGFDTQKNALYDQLSQQTTGMPATTENTMGVLNAIKTEMGKSSWGQNPLASRMQKMISDFEKGRTFDEIKATRTDIGNELKATRNDPTVTKNVGALKQLYGALSKDLDASATAMSPEIGSLLKQTDQMYVETMNKLNSYYGKKIFGAEDTTKSTGPENLVDTLLKPKQYSKLPTILEVLGEDGSNALRGGFLMKLVKESTTQGEFSPAKFSTALSKYGDEFQRNLFTDSQYRNLQLMKTMGEAYTKSQAVAKGSQTAFLGKVSAAPYLLLTHPGVLATGAILDYGLTKFLNSNIGKQYLGEGFYRNVEQMKSQMGEGIQAGMNAVKQGMDQYSKDFKNNMGSPTRGSIKIGKGDDGSYAMAHRPSKMGPGHNIEENAPDFYDHPEWYTHSKDGTYQESIAALQKIRNKPEAIVTIYRAAPKNELNNGDWVSLSKKYAQQESMTEGTPVHAYKVKAKDIQFAGDDINEFGYWGKPLKPQGLPPIKEKPSFNTASPAENALLQEAKKYKSAEEFVKKQPVIYHGTDKTFKNFDLNKMEGGVAYFTDNLKDFEFGNSSGAVGTKIKMERYLHPKLKLGGYDEADKFSTGELINQGYHGLKLEKDGSTWYEIFNPNKDLLTKAQLKDLWNQAHGK